MNKEFTHRAGHDAHDYQRASDEQKQRITAILEAAEEEKKRLRLQQAASVQKDVLDQMGRMKDEPHLRPWWSKTSRVQHEQRAALEVAKRNTEALATVDIYAAREVDKIFDEIRKGHGIDRNREVVAQLKEWKKTDRLATRPELTQRQQADAPPIELAPTDSAARRFAHDALLILSGKEAADPLSGREQTARELLREALSDDGRFDESVERARDLLSAEYEQTNTHRELRGAEESCEQAIETRFMEKVQSAAAEQEAKDELDRVNDDGRKID